MKNLLAFFLCTLLLLGCSDKYDDSDIRQNIESLQHRIETLETVMRAYENNLLVHSITPTENGYEITFSDGSSVSITNGKNADNIEVSQDDDAVYFKLPDDTVITIPKGDNSAFAIAFDTTEVAILNGGESKTIGYTITGATEQTVVKALAQDGWKVSVDASTTEKGTITITAPDPIVESEVLVFANDGSYRTVMAAIDCMQGQIILADNVVEASVEGGTREIKLSTNLDYTVDIPQDAQSWLSVVETRAMREETVTFQIAANDGVSRFATVRLLSEQGTTLQTIIFKQLGTCTEVHVETLGGLEAALADYDYANLGSLKITGVLNDVDFMFIHHEMPQLKSLDISEVNITALPAKAFYQSPVENLILPDVLTEIGESMFAGSKLKATEIPSSVQTIGSSAFASCPLTSIEIPASVQTIGSSAFSYCSITSIEIPASVETIGATAFKGCSKLTTVTFEKGSRLKTIKGGYYYYAYGTFSNCSALTSIEIPASVETIEATAFEGCSSLTTVTFEKGSQLKTIEGGYDSSYYHGAFSDCSALTSIEIPASVETIEAAAFKGCSSLATVTFEKGSQLKTIEGGYDYYSSSYYYYGAFCELKNLKTFDASACTQVESIGDHAFYQDSELQLFKIGTATPPKCGDSVFSGISSYSVLKVPSGCANAYKSASEWREFTSITGLDE